MELISGTNNVTMDLMTSTGGVFGLPDSLIESYVFVNQMPQDDGQVHTPLSASSVINPVLTAGTEYWLAAFPGAADTQAIWPETNQNVFNSSSGSNADGSRPWSFAAPGRTAAFEIFGNPVPEPTTLASLGLAASMLLIRCRRKL